ncbi:heavy metal translocating P-type ATPase [Rhodovulum sp. DZ06]|uniref:heavy metal translocating P-type ATPase n=1 Tax=Rhodovulum sp. DZ06 TaxID=3425126 RepID=UPI003D33682E
MPEDRALLDERHALTFQVAGMNCAGCAGRVEKALAALPGAEGAEVNLALERATLRGPIALSDAAEAVAATGFAVRETRVALALSGMTCAGCAGRVERALAAAPGVIRASVNLATETADIRIAAGETDAPALIEAVRKAGYDARLEDDGSEAAAEEEAARAARDRNELILGALLTAPMVTTMILMVLGVPAHLPVWAEAALAIPVWAWIGRRFHRGAWAAVKARAGNMDVLVSLGSTAAVVYSLMMIALHGADAAGRLYFEAAAVIVTLVLFGKWLESRAKASAAEALRALMALRPEEAVIRRAGKEETVPIAQVVLGDVVVVRPGERIAVDGEIIKGETEVDESLVTGEPLPATRRTGDKVIAGSVNGPGLVRVRAEAVGADGTVARIARMVAEAQTGKAPIQRLVDRISAIFVPAVLAFSLLTLVGWLAFGGSVDAAFSAALSVLVIACPCALGLATPAALVAGTGAAAKAGILIRDVETLERAGRVDAIAFDKTGTLTLGAPQVDEIRVLSGTRAEALALAAAVQAGSEHPLGRAVLAAAEGVSAPEAEEFRAVIGEGVEARIEGAQVRMGRPEFAAPGAEVDAQALTGAGRTVVLLAKDGAPVALFALSDTLREDAAEAVAALKARGLSVVMLTGDSPEAAARIAEAAGIDEVKAALRPGQKTEALAELQSQGRHVAMIGDGINDAPALAAAELGMAMGGGADAALASAGVTLLRKKLTLVPAALSIANATARKIRQNLFWAFAYNAVCLPVAAAGLLDPGVAGAAMAASSVSVAANALLLKRWTPEGSA